MNDMDRYELQINALVDGELDEAEAAALKAEAERDPALAKAIIEAYELRQLMASLPDEPAPRSLRRKLKAVPREQKALAKPASFGPRWAMGMGLAAVPLAVMLVVTQLGPKEPSAAELAQAERDLVVAMGYLQKVTRAANREIEDSIGDGFSRPVTEETVRAVAAPFDLDKEQDA
ncbi:hypothetical protein F3N42_09750 [Marinihelvus fidelis]|uniref:Anti sigma-E protein RseA N-terminal domain-containing protein n=1 Tax=Marinihelvus fidelis TaxID=2613842 RepID=A0A5N0TE63_9GAMM|nr:hypothetical protein [Marinihelvus fidelis]KAA9131589.1 hypothetical protein F3N42_09750 [Marinihelvus fidelis]